MTTIAWTRTWFGLICLVAFLISPLTLQAQNDGRRPIGRPQVGGQQSYIDQLMERDPNRDDAWRDWNAGSGERFPNDPEADRRFAPEITEGVRVGPVDPNSYAGDPSQPAPEFFEASLIVARVGDHTILAGDLLPEINELIETQLPGMPESFKVKQREKLMEQLIPKAVEQKLMFVNAVQQLPDPEKLTDVLDSVQGQFIEMELPRLIERYRTTSATELDARLRSYGGSLRRRRQQWTENQFIGFMIRQQIDVDPEVTHQELLDYYHEHLEDYEIPAKVRWQELMVRFKPEESKQETFYRLAQMGDEVVFGAPFEAVARRGSEGFTSSDGGLRDWTTRGALRAENIDAALFELPVNYLSDIMESEQGFHIIRVLERQDATHVSFRDAQVEIRQALKTEKQNEELNRFMARLEGEIPVWTILDEAAQNSASR